MKDKIMEKFLKSSVSQETPKENIQNGYLIQAIAESVWGLKNLKNLSPVSNLQWLHSSICAILNCAIFCNQVVLLNPLQSSLSYLATTSILNFI